MAEEARGDCIVGGEVSGPRAVIAYRAARELYDNAVINFGFGIPDGVAKLVAAHGETDRYYQTIEHGTYGGELLDGVLFGFARNASCMIDSPSQFDLYSGGGLDIAFLGFGEMDSAGNVNVSRLGGTTVGPGGFMDIAQNARKVVFCGTFEAKGVEYEVDGERIAVKRNGQIRKMVQEVDQITFSGLQAVESGQKVLCITERAVFELTEAGMYLREVAPGIDLKADVLDRMEFEPIVPDEVRQMPFLDGG